MFIRRNLVYAVKIALDSGFKACLFLSLCLLVLVLIEDGPSHVISNQEPRHFDVVKASRIELVQRELLNENAKGRYDEQGFVPKTSDIADRVFEIIPDVKNTSENETELYQVDATQNTHAIKSTSKFLFVLHHYEQLGKATHNLVQLCAIAKQMKRFVVEPFVRDSRMCGVPGGWSGQQRKRSRLFRPFSTYFDVDVFNNLLSSFGYATMKKLETFKTSCSNEKTTIVHFIYADVDAEQSLRKWYNLSVDQYIKVKNDVQRRGYCDCPFIDKGLNISNRIGDLNVGRELCVDPEKIRNIDEFEDQVLQNDRCAVIVHWRGIGKNRTNFRPRVKLKPWSLVTSLKHSNLIRNEVARFKEVSFIDNHPYIAIHIRSERQLQWYGIEKLNKCIAVMIQQVEKLKEMHKIDKIFLSTDLSAYGSDTLIFPSAQDTEFKQKLGTIQTEMLKQLQPLSYAPHTKRNSVLFDKGVVAITEMNLLFDSSHLVTIGSGTFQQWIIDVFIKKYSKDKHQNWTITRVCNREEKRNVKI
ncbi:uncharacterized protein LOC116308380 [Actinia tenebrosa]|uniref:Uncharacterized protein LOC116308380 n=1 Tax=Actinia tenebrosa TaxID=6105 RepID=A0A6P8JDW2_ACTTE|nr:uncharacterized protein LOC116308380 [Actinia tenebrosa]